MGILYFKGEDGEAVAVSAANPVPVSGAGGGGMEAADISATSPVTWDADTATVALNTVPVVKGGTGATSKVSALASLGGQPLLPEGAVMADTAPTVTDSDATDAAGLVADFNALLAVLRTRGVIA